jgi:hypothetical protein
MAGKIITLPFRVWLGSARLLTRAAGGVAVRAASLAGHAIGSSPDGAPTSPATAEPGWREETIEEPISPVEVEHPHADTEPRPVHTVTAEPRPVHTVTAVRPLNEQPEAPVAQEPVHVSEEPVLVREEAEPGAEDGAGAQLTVIEPWNGYARMTARDVIARAQRASRAELAAVRLYEARHRSRQTVLAAVDRQLKLASGPNPA